MVKSAYSIRFDCVVLSTGAIKEMRIDGIADLQTARRTFAAMRRFREERGFRLDHPRIVGPDGAVYAVN